MWLGSPRRGGGAEGKHVKRQQIDGPWTTSCIEEVKVTSPGYKQLSVIAHDFP